MTDTTSHLAEREDALNERDRKLVALATAADRRAVTRHRERETELVQTAEQRLTDFIDDAVKTSMRFPNTIDNAREVAAAILADTELCEAIADTLPVVVVNAGPVTAEQQLAAIDLVEQTAQALPAQFRDGRLRTELASLRRRVEIRRDEDIEIGASFTRTAAGVDCSHTATVGAIVRAAVTATGLSITDDRPRAATSEETDRG